MKGCWGKIISIDLSDRTVRTLTPPERLYREYIGASGIGARLLYDMTARKQSPLAPTTLSYG